MQARALVPKDQCQLEVRASHPVQHQIPEARILLGLAQPTNVVPEGELEGRYFRIFADRIAREMCPYFEPETWRRMILQACEGQAAIRGAASAVGALGKAYEVAQGQQNGRRLKEPGDATRTENAKNGSGHGGSITGQALLTEASTHHRRALEQYGKAIKQIRADIADGTQSLRTSLISCIVLTCFEAILGDHESAAGQLLLGLAMIQEWRARQHVVDAHPQGFSSPVPDEVDDYLVQTFGRMEITCMSVFDPRSVQTHEKLRLEGSETVRGMPKLFDTLEPARVYLDLITRRFLHFNALVKNRPSDDVVVPTPPNTPPLEDSSGSAIPIPTPKGIPWIDSKKFNPGSRYPAKLFNEQALLMSEFVAWTSAFKPLLTRALAAGNQDAISALSLVISSTANQVSLRAAFLPDECSFDAFLPEFKHIVAHTSLLVEAQSQKGTGAGGPMLRFAFDTGILPPLYLVTIKCRDPLLRRRALQLMERYPRREGVWDSVATAHLCRWIVRLEEEAAKSVSHSISPSPLTVGGYESPGSSAGCSSGRSEDGGVAEGPGNLFVPEEARVRRTWMRFNLQSRTASMNCLQMDTRTGAWVPRNEISSW